MNPTMKIAETSATAVKKNSVTSAKRMAGVTAIAATLFSGCFLSAQVPAESGSRTITLSVYDYAAISQTTLRSAENEANRILADAGVHARWVACPVPAAEHACGSTASANGYALQLAQSTEPARETPDVVGYVADPVSTPYTARIFYDRVNKLAGGDTSPSGVLLGRVLAREIGLMLGVKTSPHDGIMQAQWSERQLSLLAGSEVLFTSGQARTLRAHLARQATPSVSLAALSSPSKQ